MDTGKLKTLRTLVPGTLLLIESVPVYTFLFGTSLTSIKSIGWPFAGAGLVGAYVLGAIYNLTCFRRMFNGKSHSKITSNIKKQLLDIGRTKLLTEVQRNELLRGKKLMDVFYALIDSNESLKERSKLVRDNGLVWSSIADLVVLGTVFGAIYVPLSLITHYSLFLIWGAISGLIAFIAAKTLHPLAEKKHIKLSNDQLDFIATQMKDKVTEKVDAL